MYNLEEYLSGKTIKQVINLMKTRAKNERLALATLDLDRYPYNELRRYQTKVRKAWEALDDNVEFMRAASYCFNEELWESMVSESFGYLEGWTQEELQEG